MKCETCGEPLKTRDKMWEGKLVYDCAKRHISLVEQGGTMNDADNCNHSGQSRFDSELCEWIVICAKCGKVWKRKRGDADETITQTSAIKL